MVQNSREPRPHENISHEGKGNGWQNDACNAAGKFQNNQGSNETADIVAGRGDHAGAHDQLLKIDRDIRGAADGARNQQPVDRADRAPFLARPHLESDETESRSHVDVDDPIHPFINRPEIEDGKMKQRVERGQNHEKNRQCPRKTSVLPFTVQLLRLFEVSGFVHRL